MKAFEGRVAIITGAGDGIGLGIAKSFATLGAVVVIAEINPKGGERGVREVEAIDGKALFVQTDVSKPESVKHMVDVTMQTYGRIDILVNNAGVVVHGSILDTPIEAWQRQMDVQLTGPFLTSKYVAPHMMAAKFGRIINISSGSAANGRSHGGSHCATKGGLTMLTKVCAMEFGPYGITVNAVAPGLIDVPTQRDEANISREYQNNMLGMTPMGRLGEVQDIANMVQFLARPESEWVSGQLILVDGGLTAGHLNLGGNGSFALLDGHE